MAHPLARACPGQPPRTDRRRIACLATSLLVILGLGVPALCAAAQFRGKTNRAGKVSFRVSGSKVSRFAIAVVFKCTDGDRFPEKDRSFGTMTLRNGRFSDVSSGAKGAWRSRISGTITATRAVGKYSGKERYNRRGRLDKHGSVVCTAKARFRAKGPDVRNQAPGTPTPPPTPAPTPRPVPTQPADWGVLLTRTANQGAWYQPVTTSLDNLWFFHTLGAAGYRQGTRNAFFNHNYGTSPYPADFIWYVQGNILYYEWVPLGFVWHQTQLVSYDAARDTLRVISDDGGPATWYGCRSGALPALLRGPATCP